jgi:hypothetical protein
VNSEPKAFASLSSGLLARKGAARPAMRPQGFNQTNGSLDDLGWNDMGFDPPKPSSNPLRDIQGPDEAPAPRVPFAGLTPLESPVHSQQAEIAERLSSNEPEAAEVDTAEAALPVEEPLSAAIVAPASARVDQPEPEPAFVAQPQPVRQPRRTPARPRSAPGSSGKAAFTLRLDPDRHLKLRLACAVGGRSAQQLVTDALDQLLAQMPELDAMAEKAKRKGS